MKKLPSAPAKKEKETTLEWHLFDAAHEPLGRLATKAASLLLGKHRTDSAAHTIAPIRVVITNTDNLKVTGGKETKKMYRRYTGYPGGLRERTLADQRQRDSRLIMRNAISGMLPKNSLRDKRLANLKLYKGMEHPHEAQLGQHSSDSK